MAYGPRRYVWKKIRKAWGFKCRTQERFSCWFYTGLARHLAASCGRDLRVNARSIFGGTCHFGDNCNFNGMVVKGRGSVKFGNNFHSGENCRIITENHNYDCGVQIPYDATYVPKTVIIEDNVWFCDNVTAVGNVTIGEGAILGAGSVVSRDVPRCAIVGGNPAQVIKYRDVEHYDKLKKENAVQ